jgi:hypothetical protein
LKSRSTAMAIETDHFSRDDLYTLFITARMINFLKGIPPGGRQVMLQEALDMAARTGKRGEIGAELMRRMLEEKRLYAVTKQGLKPLSRFKTDLFFKVFKKIPSIASQQGTLIDLSSTPLRPPA